MVVYARAWNRYARLGATMRPIIQGGTAVVAGQLNGMYVGRGNNAIGITPVRKVIC